jgi:hypothetical protein
MTEKNFKKEVYWSEVWKNNIEVYLKAPPRTGIWLKSWLPKTFSILEIGGGSCRDSRYLFNEGYNSVGTDFDEKTLKYLTTKHPKSSFPMRHENAFAFSFDDGQFDVTFHNGLWVLFDDNNKIKELLKEQLRVTKKTLIAIVHNKDNKNLKYRFLQKSFKDSLFNIRFFSRREIKNIISNSRIQYTNLRIKKFGGIVDILYQFEKMFPPLSFVIRWIVPRLYKFLPWSKVERIVLIIDL